MKVILTEDVPSLGRSGEVVEVKPGHGRNYLLPRHLAVAANEKNLRQLDHHKAVIAKKQEKAKAAAGSVADKLKATPVKIARRAGEQDKLFGSVTALDVADALAAQGVRIDRRSIHLAEPIKALGDFEVEVKLHHDIVGKIKVQIVKQA
jgi:large subunit ribosomal protein L9